MPTYAEMRAENRADTRAGVQVDYGTETRAASPAALPEGEPGAARPCRAAVAHFHTQGFLVIPNLFGAGETAAVAAALSRLARSCGADGCHPLPGVGLQFEGGAGAGLADPAARELLVRKFFDMGQADPFFWDHLRDARIIAVLDALLGPGARLLQCMALVKPPGIGAAKDWHQDLPYFPLSPGGRCLGLWLALDDADLANGCMQVIPRSQRGGLQPHVDGPTGWRLPDDAVAARVDEAISLPMAAGSALLFDAALWHFTDHNHSPRRRRAVQYHYVSAGTRAPGRELWDLDRPRPPRALA